MSKRKYRFWRPCLSALAAGMLLIGCGYHFSGGGALPGGVTRLRIDMLKNRTGYPGLEWTVTNALIYQFNRSGKASVVNTNADAVLSGTINSLWLSAVSHGETLQTATMRSVAITLNLTLTSSDGRVLWRGRNLTDSQAYLVQGDAATVDQAEKAAIQTLVDRLAENIHNRITSDF